MLAPQMQAQKHTFGSPDDMQQPHDLVQHSRTLLGELQDYGVTTGEAAPGYPQLSRSELLGGQVCAIAGACRPGGRASEGKGDTDCYKAVAWRTESSFGPSWASVALIEGLLQ